MTLARARRPGFGLALALIALGALAVRLYYALHVMGHHRFVGDGIEFHYLARTLADTHSYVQPFEHVGGHRIPTAEKPPLYPGYLAVWTKLGLSSFRWNMVASCLLGVGTVATIGLVARRAAGPRTGLIAAALAAIYLELVLLDGSLRSESLYVLLAALSVLAAYRMIERPTLSRAALLGAAIGLATLTRAEGLVLVAVLALPALWLVREPRRERMRLLAAVCAGCAVLVVPWLARNWIVFDRPTPISTNEGGLLAGANCRHAYYGPLMGAWGCFPHASPSWGRNESVISGKLQARGLRYAGDHAGRVPAVAGARLLRTWELWEPSRAVDFEAANGDRDPGLNQAAQISFYVLALLAIAGALVLRRRGHPLRLLLALPILVTVVTVATYGSTRFRAAAEVAIVVLAAVALERLGGHLLESVRGGSADARTIR